MNIGGDYTVLGCTGVEDNAAGILDWYDEASAILFPDNCNARCRWECSGNLDIVRIDVVLWGVYGGWLHGVRLWNLMVEEPYENWKLTVKRQWKNCVGIEN